MSANLNDFFQHKVCINLDRRPDRWERVRARFALHNINRVTRFPALDGRNLEIPAGWKEEIARDVARLLRVYESPNNAWRLSRSALESCRAPE